MKLTACRHLRLEPLTGDWYRAIRHEHWETRLSARHTATATGRFNVGSVENPSYQVLYLAQDHQLALFEVSALLGKPQAPIPNPRSTWTTLNFRVVLQAVADLTKLTELRRIGTSAQELTGKWDQYEEP